MYFEEKMIDGVMCFRTTPDGEWRPFDIKELSRRYAAALSDDGWTYCDDRLPEEDDEFLVLYDFGDDSTGPFHSTAEFFAEHEDPAGWLVHRATNPTARVIAYRPLEPAKGRDV